MISSQNKTAPSINSALQHIQTVSAILEESEEDADDLKTIDYDTADEMLFWVDDMLVNYQRDSTSDSNILLPSMLELVEQVQTKALNNYIRTNSTNITSKNDEDSIGTAARNEILDSAVTLTLNAFTYGSQSQVLGEEISVDSSVCSGRAIRSRPTKGSFQCPNARFGIDLAFPDRFYNGMNASSPVTCGLSAQVISSVFMLFLTFTF